MKKIKEEDRIMSEKYKRHMRENLAVGGVLTEGILGEDGLVSLQGIRVTLIVDSSDSELVLVAWLKSLHIEEWRSHMPRALQGRKNTMISEGFVEETQASNLADNCIKAI